jgi:hypothetical protein
MIIYVQKIIYGRTSQNYSSEPHKTRRSLFSGKILLARRFDIRKYHFQVLIILILKTLNLNLIFIRLKCEVSFQKILFLGHDEE